MLYTWVIEVFFSLSLSLFLSLFWNEWEEWGGGGGGGRGGRGGGVEQKEQDKVEGGLL